MIARCLEEECEFGIVWMADDGLRPIGCACEIAEVLERPAGRAHQPVARGTRPFRIEERQEELPYPAGSGRVPRRPRGGARHARPAGRRTRRTPSSSRQATDRTPDPDEIGEMTAYEMAATVEFGLDAKQGLLDLRSEAARLKLVDAPVPRRAQAAGLRRARPGARALERQGPLLRQLGQQRAHARAGHRGGSRPSSAASVRSAPWREQQRGHLRVVGVGGLQQRRVAALLDDVRVRRRPRAARGRRRGRRAAAAECSGRTRAGLSGRRRRGAPAASSSAHGGRAAEERGEVQRREALGRAGGERVRVGLEVRAQHVEPPSAAASSTSSSGRPPAAPRAPRRRW